MSEKKQILTAVQDLKTNSFGYVQTSTHKIQAQRMFEQVIRKGDSDLAAYPQDFVLVHLADYYPHDGGRIEPLSNPSPIATGVEVQAAIENSRSAF